MMRAFQLLLAVVLFLSLRCRSCWSNEVNDILDEYPTEENSWHVTCDCGLTNKKMASRIIGGENVTYDKYPFMAALINSEDCGDDCIRPRCGAVIVSSNYLLTAAHCVQDRREEDRYFVVAGTSRLDCVTGSGVLRRIIDITTSDYNLETQENDIAILKVFPTFFFHLSERLGPVCLPAYSHTGSDVHREYTIMGFGITDEGTTSKDLLETNINTMKFAECREAYAHEKLRPLSIDKQTCTIGIHGSCNGDSGGPLIYKDPLLKRFVLDGLISWGPGNCTTLLPRINTRIAFYVSWIQEMTDNEVCVVTY